MRISGIKPAGNRVLLDFLRPRTSVETLPKAEEELRAMMYIDGRGRPWSAHEIVLATKLGHEIEFADDWEITAVGMSVAEAGGKAQVVALLTRVVFAWCSQGPPTAILGRLGTSVDARKLLKLRRA